MKRILLCLSLISVISFTTQAQTSVDLTWMNGFGAISPGDDKLGASYTDASGNIYITGQVSSGTDFDPSAATNSFTASYNAYLAKYNAGGSLVWAKVFTGTSQSEGNGIGVDGAGNVYVVGRFNFGDINLDPSASNYTEQAQYFDMFVAKYSSSGNFVWGESIGASGASVKPEGMSVNSAGEIFLYGAFNPSPTVNFNPLAAAVTMTTNGSYDGFVAKYTTNFILQWAFNLGEFQNDYVYDLEVDGSNNVYALGTYQGNMDLDPSATNSIVTSFGIEDGYLAKYNSSGNLIWGDAVGGILGDGFYKMKKDNAGDILVSGYMESVVMDADPGAGSFSVNKIGSSQYDLFLGKYSSSTGALVWAKTTGGDELVKSYDVSCDQQNNIYLGGFFAGSCDFDFSTSSNSLTAVISPPYRDAFLSKYDAVGNFIYAKHFGGGSDDSRISTISVDNSNNIVIGGMHTSAIDVDFNATNNLQAFGGADFFIIKYSQCIDAASPTVAVTIQTMCANGVATLSISGGNLNSATDWVWSSLVCGSGTVGVGTTVTVNPVFTTDYFVRGEGGCTSPGPCANATVVVNPSHQITGTVTTSPSIPVAGMVQLFRYEGPLTKWDSVTYQNINASGIYTFNAVNSGSYIIMCIPSSTALVKTYAPNMTTWKNSTIFSHGCTADYVINIDVIPIATLTPGPGILSGKIVEGVNYGGRGTAVAPGNPIGGLNIKGGKNPGGSVVAQGKTMGDGTYTLSGLPISGVGESYYVFVDIPGVDTSGTHHIAITTASTSYSDLDFVVDSDYVKPVDYTAIKELKLDGEMVKVYPNPAKDLVYIQMDSKSESNITLELYDLFGKKILSDTYNSVQGEFKTSIDVGRLNRGIYFVKLRLNTGEARIKLVLSE